MSVIYVSDQNGNNTWSGNLPVPNDAGTDGPLKTLNQANTNANANDTVYVAPGTYRETLACADNGVSWLADPECHIFIADTPGKVRITSCKADEIPVNGAVITVTGRSNVTFDGFYIDGSADTSYSVLNNGVPNTSLLFRNCHIRGRYGANCVVLDSCYVYAASTAVQKCDTVNTVAGGSSSAFSSGTHKNSIALSGGFYNSDTTYPLIAMNCVAIDCYGGFALSGAAAKMTLIGCLSVRCAYGYTGSDASNKLNVDGNYTSNCSNQVNANCLSLPRDVGDAGYDFDRLSALLEPSIVAGIRNLGISTVNLLTKAQSDLEGVSNTPPTGFDSLSWAVLTVDTQEAYQGDKSIKVQTPGLAISEGLATTGSSNLVVASPNQTYTASAWVKGSGKIHIAIVEFSNTGYVAHTPVSVALNPNVWQRVSATRTFGASGTKAGCYIRTESTAQKTTFWVDGLQIEKSDSATPWVPGTGAYLNLFPTSVANASGGTWSPLGTPTTASIENIGTSKEGATAIHLVTDAANEGVYPEGIALTAGIVYSFSVWAKGTGTLSIYPSSPTLTTPPSASLTLSDTWQRVAVTFVAPDTQPVYCCVKATSATADCYLDCWQLEKIDAAAWAAGGGSINLLSKLASDNEGSAPAWSNGGGTVSLTPSDCWQGTKSLSVVCVNDTDGAAINAGSCSAGAYIFSCYVKGTAGAKVKLGAYMATYLTPTVYSPDLTLDGTWQRISLAFQPTGTGNLYLYVMQSGATSVTFLADGFQLEQPQPSAWMLGGTGVNLLTANQSSAETGTTGFSTTGSPSVTRDFTRSYDGSACIKVSGCTSYWMGVEFTYVSVTAGLAYTASAYVMGATGGENVLVSILWRNNAGVDVGRSDATISNLSSTNWTRSFVSGVAPSGATRAHVRVQTTGSGQTPYAASYYVDALQLELSFASPWVVGGGVNLLTAGQSSLEGVADANPPTGFGNGGTAHTSIVTSEAYRGVNALRMQGYANQDRVGAFTSQTVAVGDVVTITCYVKGASATGSVYLNYYTPGYQTANGPITPLTTSWQRLSLSVVATIAGTPAIFVFQSGATNVDCYIDCLQIEKIDSSRVSAWTAGALAANLLTSGQSSVEGVDNQTVVAGFTGRSGSGVETLSVVPFESWQGSQCLQVQTSGGKGIKTNGSSNHAAVNSIDLPYTFSAWVKVPSGVEYYLAVIGRDTNDAAVANQTFSSLLFTGTGNWQRQSLTAVFTSTNVKYIDPQIYTNTSCTFYIDGLQIEQAQASPWQPGGEGLNLLTRNQSDVEAGLTGWADSSPAPSEPMVLILGDSWQGTSCIRFGTNADSAGAKTSGTVVTPGAFIFSCYVKGSGQIRLRAYSAGNVATTYSPVCQLTSEWQRVYVPFVSTGSGNLSLYIIQYLSGEATIYFDAAQLEQAFPSPWQPGTGALALPTTDILGRPRPAGKGTINLLTRNQSDASDTSEFVVSTSTKTLVTDIVWTGNTSIRVSSPAQYKGINIPAAIPVVPGKTYTFSVYVKGAVGGEPVLGQLGWYQSDGTTPSVARPADLTQSIPTSNSVWTRVVLSAVAPIDAAKANVSVTNNATSGFPTVFYIDGLQLEEGSQATPWVPGQQGTISSALGPYEVIDEEPKSITPADYRFISPGIIINRQGQKIIPVSVRRGQVFDVVAQVKSRGNIGARPYLQLRGDGIKTPTTTPANCVLNLDMAEVGTTVTDKSGNGHDGTVVGASVVDAGNGFGLVRQFNGGTTTSNYVKLTGDVIGVNDLTFEAWVKLNSYGADGFGSIICNGQFRLYSRNATSNIYFSRNNGINVYDPTNVVTLNTWVHLALIRTAAGFVQLFINGVAVDAGKSGQAPIAGSGDTYIGHMDLTGNRVFDGQIASVLIYNTALTADQIKARYQATRPDALTARAAKPTDRTVLNVDMQDEGSIINDHSRGLKGTIIGATRVAANNPKLPSKPYARNFAGGAATDRITFSSDLIGTGDVSIEVWLYARGSGGGGYGRIIDNARTMITLYPVGGNSEAQIRITDDGAQHVTISSAILPMNGWYHFVATRQTGVWNAYLDAVSIISNQALPIGTTSPVNTYIGNWTTSDRAWDGMIGPVRIYNYAMSADEVAALYNTDYDPWEELSISAQAVSDTTVDVVLASDDYLPLNETHWSDLRIVGADPSLTQDAVTYERRKGVDILR